MAKRVNQYLSDDGTEFDSLKAARLNDRGMEAAKYLGQVFQDFPSGMTAERAMNVYYDLTQIFKGK